MFEVFTFKIFFHKGGQTRYKSSILPFQHCCHDDRSRHSRPPRDGEKKERKWKDAQRRYKMMRKLKQRNEKRWEETTRKSEAVIKGGWRDNRMKGPQIREDWCSQVLAQQSSWLFMSYTLYQCRQKTCRSILRLVCGLSKATALTEQRSPGLHAALHIRTEGRSLSRPARCRGPIRKPTLLVSLVVP